MGGWGFCQTCAGDFSPTKDPPEWDDGGPDPVRQHPALALMDLSNKSYSHFVAPDAGLSLGFDNLEYSDYSQAHPRNLFNFVQVFKKLFRQGRRGVSAVVVRQKNRGFSEKRGARCAPGRMAACL